MIQEEVEDSHPRFCSHSISGSRLPAQPGSAGWPCRERKPNFLNIASVESNPTNTKAHLPKQENQSKSASRLSPLSPLCYPSREHLTSSLSVNFDHRRAPYRRLFLDISFRFSRTPILNPTYSLSKGRSQVLPFRNPSFDFRQGYRLMRKKIIL